MVQVGDVKKEEKKPAAAAAEVMEYQSHPGYYYPYQYHYQWQPEPVYEKHYSVAAVDGYGYVYPCSRAEPADTCSIM